MSLFFRIFQHLLPSGKPWRIRDVATGHVLWKFFRGLSEGFPAARDYTDAVFGDAFPDTTRALSEWENQFGLQPNVDEATRRLALAAEWAAGGGQSPGYVQGVLQTAGFDVFVHEWWSSGPPYVARDPHDYTEVPLVGLYQCYGVDEYGPDVGQPQCGDGLVPVDPDVRQYQCNRFLANDPHYIVNRNLTDVAPPPIPADPAKWPYFWYVGAETFPDFAPVALSRKSEFERLLLKLGPTHLWIVTLIDYFNEDDVIDTEGGDPLLTESGEVLLIE